MVRDTIDVLPNNSVLDAQLSDDTPFENFVRLTEDYRRDRLRKLDAGDQTAALRLQKPQAPPTTRQFQADDRRQGGRGFDRPAPPRSHAPRAGAPPARGDLRWSAASERDHRSNRGGESRKDAPRGNRPPPAPPVPRSHARDTGGAGQKRAYGQGPGRDDRDRHRASRSRHDRDGRDGRDGGRHQYAPHKSQRTQGAGTNSRGPSGGYGSYGGGYRGRPGSRG